MSMRSKRRRAHRSRRESGPARAAAIAAVVRNEHWPRSPLPLGGATHAMLRPRWAP